MSSEVFDVLERFVDADEAAAFLSITRRHVLELARAGILPAHPIGHATRRVWRFRLSELAAALLKQSRFRFAPRTGHSMVRPQAVPDATEGD
jgi:excisionase family DNA binding protein